MGEYPEEGLKKYREYLPEMTRDDMRLIHQPLDFYGQNIYQGVLVRADESGGSEIVPWDAGHAKTAMNWYVTPDCLYYGAKFLTERYRLPLYITENGMSAHDAVSLDGKVHDASRIDFLEKHLAKLEKAADDGFDIGGYFQWSLMDNFEWACGYRERFGLIYVDYKTQKRIIKDSGYWYKRYIEAH